MTSFSYALVMMHAMSYIRVQDTGGHERLLTPEPRNGVRRIEPATAPNGMSDDTNEFS